MASRGQSDSRFGEVSTDQARWPARPKAPEPASSYRYLLDLDLDLAEELDVRMRLAARPAVTAMVLKADPGELRLSKWLQLAGTGFGLLVVDGVAAANVRVGDRIAAELIGAGDLIQPWNHEDAELAFEIDWRALLPLRLALLDNAFAQRVQPWPQITAALLRRTGRQTRRMNVQRAICNQPRLDVRLALLLWHLGARWGKVEPGGVRLSLPLTHQLLGWLVGAERPSVSHALARLANAGLVSGHGDEWHLHGSVDNQLTSMIEPNAAGAEQLLFPVALRNGPR
jgi:CRP/FNR family transcriptional regulator, cyclic AMP receptor protein